MIQMTDDAKTMLLYLLQFSVIPQKSLNIVSVQSYTQLHVKIHAILVFIVSLLIGQICRLYLTVQPTKFESFLFLVPD